MASFTWCLNGQQKDRELISENAYFAALRQIQNVTFKEIKTTVGQRPNPVKTPTFLTVPRY